MLIIDDGLCNRKRLQGATINVKDVRKLLVIKDDTESEVVSHSDLDEDGDEIEADEEVITTERLPEVEETDLTSTDFISGDEVDWWVQGKNRWVSCTVVTTNKDGSVDVCESNGKPIRVLASQIRHAVPHSPPTSNEKRATATETALMLAVSPKNPVFEPYNSPLMMSKSVAFRDFHCSTSLPFAQPRMSYFCSRSEDKNIGQSKKIAKEDIVATRLLIEQKQHQTALEEALRRYACYC
eukprot:TRINITY_DN5460_c0_g1_i2.p1 TRINITY_DN5460_c0_g1~~TRINITY_DN5460_c0_g1_i2.p1  ORF type:complete len:239 (+),score=51.51 TRINITY_DN5460_c0_g1_i2:77-793(+)